MPTNQILPFAPTDTGTNLLTQGDYAAASDRTNGNQPGVASSKLVNKALRQTAYISSQFAQFLSDKTGTDVLDDATPAKLLSQIKAAIFPIIPTITGLTSGSGTHLPTYYFFIATGSATVGATYTNNSQTFTVKATVASGVIIAMTGSGLPSVSGTLTKATGTGDATLTFYAMRAPLYLRVRLTAGGGGGGNSGNTPGTGATAGGDTSFGTSLLVAQGGGPGGNTSSQIGGGGGGSVFTLNAPAVGTKICGSNGSAGMAGTYQNANGGQGGASGMFPNQPGSTYGATGNQAFANSGGGGQGGGTAATGTQNGTGGGGGAGIDAFIPFSNGPTWAYSVGAAGAAAGATTNGYSGGIGAAGYIEIVEHYQ